MNGLLPRFMLTTFLVIVFVATLALGCSAPVPDLDRAILGQVRDADGVPLAGAQLTVGGPTWQTDTEGRFQIPVEPGTHQITITAPDHISIQFTTTIQETTARQMRDVTLHRRRILGIVRDRATTRPVSGAHVAHGGQNLVTDSAGQFSLPLIDDGALAVACPGYREMPIPYNEIASHLDANGAMRAPLDIALIPHILEGTVVDSETGHPISDAHATSRDQMAVTGRDGHYRFQYIDPGAEIHVAHPDYRPAAPITYAGLSHIEIAMRPWTTRLSVVDESTNDPLPGTLIESVHADTGAASIVTDAQGVATLRLRPGATITGSLPGYHAVAERYDGQKTIALSLMPSRLTGIIRDVVSGDVITNAMVLTLSPEREPELIHPDKDGQFVIEDALDIAQLVVKAPGYRRHTMSISGPATLTMNMEPIEARGVYIPFGLLTLPDRIDQVLDMVETTDLNAVVVDVKSDRSRLAWPSTLPLAQELGAYQKDVMDLDVFLAACHERGIYVIARIVVFKDDLLARAHPEYAVTRDTGELYVDLEELHWVDPFRQEVRDYIIALALQIAAMGFDEVQFDYLRFPSDGSTKGLVYSQESTMESRTAAMAAFCAQAYEALSHTPAYVSADVFGLTVWVDPSRDMGIGQRVDDIAPFVDYLSPMLYPTTFGEGNLGFDVPGLYPYEVIYHSVLKTKKRTSTLVRPWLQHYSIGGIRYEMDELLRQRKGAEDAGSHGWIYWNAGAKYRPEIMVDDAYDLMDEIPTPPTDDDE